MMDPTDGGYASRKFWFSVYTSALIFVSGALASTQTFKLLAPQLNVIVGGLLGALAIYCGANVGAKHVIGKFLKH